MTRIIKMTKALRQATNNVDAADACLEALEEREQLREKERNDYMILRGDEGKDCRKQHQGFLRQLERENKERAKERKEEEKEHRKQHQEFMRQLERENKERAKERKEEEKERRKQHQENMRRIGEWGKEELMRIEKKGEEDRKERREYFMRLERSIEREMTSMYKLFRHGLIIITIFLSLITVFVGASSLSVIF